MFVAAFGKHPGWNDHIDDLGLETPTLIDLKHRLYVAGIGGNIDGGTWDKLSPEQQLEGFDHVFAWRSPGDLVVGRMWSSRDGKGRAKYPMIVCAECRGYPLAWAMTEALPALETLRARCTATTDAQAVRQAMDEARAQLRERARAGAPGPEITVSDRALAELAAHPDMGPDGQGMHRVLYQVEREMADYAGVLSTTSRVRSADPRPQHMRVPACASDPAEIARTWLRAVLTQLAPSTEVLLLIPLGRGWVDVIVGRADPASLYGLRASPKALALATDIPYALDDAFLDRARKRLAAAGEDPERPIGAPARAVAADSGDSRSGGRRLLIAAGVLIGLALIVAAVGMLISGSGPPAETGGGGAPPSPPSRVDNRPPAQAPRGPGGEGGAAFDDSAWRELCTAYRTWYAQFARRLDEAPARVPPGSSFATRRDLYRSDPDLGRLLEAIAREAEGDPWSIAGVSRSRDLVAMERTAPESVRSPAAVERTVRSLGAVRALANALGGTWPLLAALGAAADRYERAGWVQPADYLRRAIRGVAPGGGRDVAPAVDEAVAAGALVRRIDEGWTRVGRHAETALASGDAVLAVFGRFSQEAAASASAADGFDGLAALARSVGEADELGGRLCAFLAKDWETIDREAFKTSRVHTQFAGSGGTATGETFEAWLFEVRNYPSLDPGLNPTRAWAVDTRLAESERMIARLRDEFGVDPPQDAAAALGALRRRAEEIRAVPFNRANQSRIVAEAEAVRRDVDALWDGLNARLEAATADRVSSAAEARARLAGRERVAADSDAINSVWRAWAGALLAAYPDEKFAEMLARAQAAETFLADVNKRMPEGPAPAATPRAWHEGLAGAARAERERRLTALLGTWPKTPPVGGPDEARIVGAACDGFGAWLASISALRADFDGIEDRLAQGFGPGDPAGADAPATVARWSAAPEWSSPGVLGAVAPIADRVAAVSRIASSSDRAALAGEVERAAPDRPELPLAAWRRLGVLTGPAWPGDAAELKIERRLAETVARVVGSMADAGRRGALEEELAAQARTRWSRAAASSRTPGDIREVMELRGDFGVGIDDLADDRVRYNAMILDLRAAAVKPGITEEAVRGLASRFAESVRALPVGGRPEVAAVLAELDAIAGGGGAPARVDVTKIGPGSVPGWVGEVVGQGDARVRFTPAPPARGPWALEFVRVEGPPGEPPIAPAFLCTIESPMGLVADLAVGAEFAAALAELLPPVERAGPVVWEASAGRLAPASAWVTRYPGGTSAADYPELARAGRPSAEHPMQHISPAAAMYVARLLGCRLPTPAEWRAARAQAGPESGWNLRDERWRVQWAAAEAVRKRGKVALWPDAGIFWPAQGLDRQAMAGVNATSGPGDDGALFFRPVASDEGGRLHHLVGNAAEFVFEPAGEFEQLPDATPGGIRAFAAAHASGLAVMGGSALSPPEMAADRPWPVDAFDVQDGVGYADVGFRLAFSAGGPSAPRLSAAARLATRLTDDVFLAP